MFDFDGNDCKQYLPCMESIAKEDVCQTHKLPNIMNWEGEQLDPLQVFRHEKFTELQASHLAGIKHPWCKACWESDNPRYKNLTQFEKDCEGLTIDFFVGNKCNLGCRTCTPFASNRLVKEMSDEIFEVTDGFFYDNNADPLNSIQWKWIKENPDKISGLTFAGGEPLFIKEVVDTLYDFTNTGVSQQMNLQLRTNGLFLSKHKKMLAKFKGIYLHLSVDAVDNLYNYIRYPGNFDDLEKSYFEFRDHCPVKDVYILSVVNALNILNLDELILWASDRLQFVEIIPQNRGIGIRSLNEDLLDLALKRSIHPTLSKLISNVNLKPNKRKMRREISYFDRTRKQSYTDYLDPKLIDYVM